jgi:hypothetical protein
VYLGKEFIDIFKKLYNLLEINRGASCSTGAFSSLFFDTGMFGFSLVAASSKWALSFGLDVKRRPERTWAISRFSGPRNETALLTSYMKKVSAQAIIYGT